MILKSRSWGESSSAGVVCLHGIGQHGGIFAELGKRLSGRGHYVVALDLRGHGDSGREPPWNVDTHVQDVLETAEALGLEQIVLLGHSFGGRVATAVTAAATDRTSRLVLLEPGLHVSADFALRGAELERLDWSFATTDGALNALLSSELFVAAPRDVVAAFVDDDVRKGPDGRFRFGFSPSAVVVAWSEMTLPPPPIAQLPTLLVRAQVSPFRDSNQLQPYMEQLADLLTLVEVPNGHNVLWESPRETIAAVERFLGPADSAEQLVEAQGGAAGEEEIAAAVDQPGG